MTRTKAFLTRPLPATVEAAIATHFDVVRGEGDRILSAVEVTEGARGCRAVFVSAMQPMGREVIAALQPELKAIGTVSVGYNHVDLEACREYGVSVFYSPGVLSDACADLAVMLVLNAARRGHEAEALVRSGKWPGYSNVQLLGIGLTGRRAGILGMGRIGQAIAARLRGFGTEIHYHNRRQLSAEEELGATYHATAEELLRVSDFLVLCAPGTPELHRFLNRERIALLPENAVVVNVSRGDTVDDDALIEALKSGRVFAAGLDVYANEPALDPRYIELENVFLTPHIASATTDTRHAMGMLVLNGILAHDAGEAPENQLC
ncbi:D-glycerate dehydrogenase [Terriglobus sp. TAA 43]|uniref:2-hydroxyacid dehydrogenase n=1 Tax=Terriglobus sp. TAA 43 TaxID=278961 RepID=UPI0006473578|nr:D-glycerate dehydrogenase [Terriglobus sp. TAA 43]